MRISMPSIRIKEDRGDRIMARSGYIIGVTKSRAVWRFGFLPYSDSAKAFGVHTEEFLWILADMNGKVLSEHHGFGINLPERFRNVIDGKI